MHRTSWVAAMAAATLVLAGCGSDGPADPTPAPTPAVSISLGASSIDVTPGQETTVPITVGRSGGFTGAIELSLEGVPDGVSASFSPASVPNGETSSTLTLAASIEAAPGGHSLTVRATGQGVQDRTGALALTIAELPAVTLGVEPDELTLVQDEDGSIEVTITRTNFAGTIELSLEGAPAGVSGSFDPASLSGDANTSTLRLEVAADAEVGEGELVIHAGGEGVEDQSATVTLIVEATPDYTLALDPASLSVEQGASGSTTVRLARTNFTQAVALSMSGAPSGVTASVSPASASGDSATLTVDVAAAAAPGTHTLTVTGQADGLEDRTATLELTVTQQQGFTLEVAPSSLTFEQGESGTATVTITRAGFTGAVALTIEGAPEGLTATVDPTSTSGTSATVTVEAAGNLAPDDYPLTIRGSAQVAPGDTREVTASLTVAVQAVTAGDWVQVSTGQHHTCAISEAGEAYCWGRNQFGQLGDGTTTQRMRPRLVTGGHTWASVTVGANHSCGITTAGEGFCWGHGGSGRLGNGSTANSSAPEPIAISGGDTWAMLSAGSEHSCGLTPDGRAYCWGRGSNGRLGNGSISSQSTRVLVSGDYTWQSVSAADWHTCGLTTVGEAHCWGSRSSGMIGDGGSSGNATIPALVQGNHTWTQVSARGFHACGITTAGDGYCWGYNNRGQLGIGNTTNQNSPALVLNDHGWSFLRPGWSSTTCGITQSGEAFCWGDNGTGQVGDGTIGHKNAPQPVSGGFTWTTMSGGTDHTCGVTAAGVAYCWGRGGFGQLGNGSAATTIYRTPIRVHEPQ